MESIARAFTQEQKVYFVSIAKDQTLKKVLPLWLAGTPLPDIFRQCEGYDSEEIKKVIKRAYIKLDRIMARQSACKDMEHVANLDIDMMLYRKVRCAGYTNIKNLLYALDYFEYCRQFNINPTLGVTKTCKGVPGIGDKRKPIIVNAIKKWYNRSQGWSIKSVTEL